MKILSLCRRKGVIYLASFLSVWWPSSTQHKISMTQWKEPATQRNDALCYGDFCVVHYRVNVEFWPLPEYKQTNKKTKKIVFLNACVIPHPHHFIIVRTIHTNPCEEGCSCLMLEKKNLIDSIKQTTNIAVGTQIASHCSDHINFFHLKNGTIIH